MTDDTAGGLRWVVVAVLVVVWIELLARVVSRVFALNFTTAGPNATALLAVLLVTAPAVAGIARLGDRWPPVAAGVVLVGLAGSTLGAPVLAALFGIAALYGVTTLAVGLAPTEGVRFAAGAALGVVLHQGLRAALDTAPTYATTVGLVALVALAVVGVGLALAVARLVDGTPTPFGASRAPPAPLVAFLFLEGAFLGAPHVVAAWSGVGPLFVTAASLVGLVGGVAVLGTLGTPGRVGLAGWTVVALASLAGLLWLGPSADGLVAPAQAGAVVLLATGAESGRHASPRRALAATAGTELAAVVVLFLVVAAINWAFFPAPIEGIVRGGTATFLLALGTLLPVTVLGTAGRHLGAAGRSEGQDSDRGDSQDAGGSGGETLSSTGASDGDDSGDGDLDPVSLGRRDLIGAAGVGGLSALGLAGGEATDAPPASPAGPPYRVMTYNVHQFLSGDDSGEHTLEPLARTLGEADPHLVGLQETVGTRITSGNVDGVRWLADRLGYDHVNVPATSEGGYGVALLSAWPIEGTRVAALPVNDSPTRPSLVATVRAPWGEMPVLVTHFQTDKPGDRQLEQAERVADAVRGMVADFPRSLVLGDFNVTPDTDVYETLTTDLEDAWLAAGNDPAAGETYSASDPRQRIDYVFTAGNWTVEAAETLGTPAVSDHLAVQARLRTE